MKKLNNLNGSDWIKNSISYFSLKPQKIDPEVRQHPATFPVALSDRFVRFFTKRGGWVIDPFVGSGSTMVSCNKLSRNCIGVDVNKNYIKLSNQRVNYNSSVIPKTTLQQAIYGDSRDIKPVLSKSDYKFDLCITSPPYWNILGKSRGGSISDHKNRKKDGLPLVYSDNPNDLGNCVNYHDYLHYITEVFMDLKEFMKPNSYIIVVVQNIIGEKRKFYPIAWDLYRELSVIYEPRQEQIWCIPNKKGHIWGFPTSYVSSVTHRYCLIFENCKEEE